MADEVSKILSQYLAGQAAEKNPTGIFGLKVTPFLTDADKNALRFQQLSQSYMSNPPLYAALNAGQNLGKFANSLFPGQGGQGEQAPVDPQQQALSVYQDTLQKTGNVQLARRQAYMFLAQHGVEGAMDKLYETEKDMLSEKNKDRELTTAEQKLNLEREENTFSDTGKNDRGQIIQENKLGKKQAVGSGPLVEVKQGEESEESKGVGKYWSGKFGQYIDAGEKATRGVDDLNALDQLLKGVGGGKFTPTGYDIARAAKSFGFDINDKTSNVDAAEVIFNKMALELRNTANGEGMPGSLSDQDRKFLTSMTPNLTKTPEGRAKVIDYYRRIYQRQIEISNFAVEYRTKNGKMNEGFATQMHKYAKEHPLFPEATVEKPKLKIISKEAIG